jgi:hypothetical protein
MLKLQSFN